MASELDLLFQSMTALGSDGGLTSQMSEILRFADHIVVVLVMLCAAWLLACRRLGRIGFVITAIATAALVGSDLLDYIAAESVAQLATWVWPRLGTANVEVWPYMILALLALALGGYSLHAKTRSVDRVIMAAISASIVVTTFLFHFTIIHGQMNASLRSQAALLLDVAGMDPDIYNSQCQVLRLNCAELEYKNGIHHENAFVAAAVKKTDGIYAAHGEQGRTDYSFIGYTGNTLDGGPLSYAYRRLDDRYRLVVDTHWVKDSYRAGEFTFYFQSMIAHLVWLLGGFAVIVGHARMFVRRRALEARP